MGDHQKMRLRMTVACAAMLSMVFVLYGCRTHQRPTSTRPLLSVSQSEQAYVASQPAVIKQLGVSGNARFPRFDVSMADASQPGVCFIRSTVTTTDASGRSSTMRYEAAMRRDGSKWVCYALELLLI